MNTILQQFGSYLARFLTKPHRSYQQFSVLSQEQLYQSLQPADLLLAVHLVPCLYVHWPR